MNEDATLALQSAPPPPVAAPVRGPTVRDDIVLLSLPTEFNMADEWYELASAGHFWFQWRFAALRTVLYQDRLDGPILEVGCGNGVARDQLEAHYGCGVDGCDVNLFALQQARPGCGTLYFYDIHQRRSEWRDRFATVVLLDTLEHVDQPEHFLRSAAFHLQPGGRLLINVPAQQWLYSRYDRVAGHVKRYSLPLLRRELRAAGLSLERHVYWGMSLIAVALARKAVLWFCSDESTIQTGFEPGTGLVDRFLRGLMQLECWCGPRMPIGASLVALARKDGG